MTSYYMYIVMKIIKIITTLNQLTVPCVSVSLVFLFASINGSLKKNPISFLVN